MDLNNQQRTSLLIARLLALMRAKTRSRIEQKLVAQMLFCTESVFVVVYVATGRARGYARRTATKSYVANAARTGQSQGPRRNRTKRRYAKKEGSHQDPVRGDEERDFGAGDDFDRVMAATGRLSCRHTTVQSFLSEHRL